MKVLLIDDATLFRDAIGLLTGLLTGLHFPGLRLQRAGKLSTALVLLAPGFRT